MTGYIFWKIIDETDGLSNRELADRWGVSHMTVYRESQKDSVRPLYRDALLRVLSEIDADAPVEVTS